MASNEYHIITEWLVPGTAAEVAAVLADATDLPRWWPAVYLDVVEIAPPGPIGVGRVIDLYTKGWLPYTLRWRLTITEVIPAQRVVLEAHGDFVGRGIWTFAQRGDQVLATYDWRIQAEKPLLKWLSFVLKPSFTANHNWAMRQGYTSLLLELARRRAPDAVARAQVPAPPGPTPQPAWLLWIGLLSVVVAGWWLVHRLRQ